MTWVPIAAAAVSAAGSLISGVGQYSASKAQTKTDRQNARLAEEQGESEAALIREKARRLSGQNRAAIGASGVDISGSFLDALADSDINAELDAQTALWNRKAEASNYRARAAQSRASGLGGVVAKKSTELPWARSELELLIDRQGLPASKAAELKRQSQLKLTDAYLGGLMIDHPELVEQSIASGSLDEYMDPADRPAWLAKAKSRADSLLQTQLALADRADRLAGQELRKRGDAAAKDLWGKFADGILDRDDIDSARDILDPGEYRALVTAVAQPGAARDNPQAIAAVEDTVGAPDFLATLNGALERGEITTDTYRSYRMIGRKLEAGNAPGTPYATTYGTIKDSLGSGGFLFGGNPEAARQSTSKALLEFDLWARENPGASIAQFDEIGRKMVDRYRAFTWDSLTAATGLPALYTGTRDGLSGPRIDQAEATALQAFDTGTYSREQLVFELKKLNDWREILKRKAGQ
uniref:Uncharacterized protein n=1 Tax=uncultured bacterium 878 TaxID=548895 RepID=B8R8L2_9BACT|nr:hypothetical protein [uncultured bacterium 878]